MKRGIVLRAGMVLFGVFVLAGAEAGLRLAGVAAGPADPDLAWTSIDPFERRGDQLVTRQEYLAALRPAEIPARKPAGGFRVVCLGGSATFGYPYPEDVAWPSVLRRWLLRLDPGRRAEVVNLGGTSYGSARALGLLRGVLRYGPDAIVVCCGDAEFVEDSYRTAVRRQGGLGTRLRSLALARVLLRILPRRLQEPPAVKAEEAGGMLFSPRLHGTVSPPAAGRRQEVLARFADNLGAIASLARSRGIPLVLCTLPSNTATWPPDVGAQFPQDPPVATRWRALLRRAEVLERGGRLGEAAAAYGDAAVLWGGSAYLWFRRGRVLLALGRGEEARAALVRARDLDPTPVRATTEINGAIRAAASAQGAALADLEAAFEAASADGAVGEALVLDYAHPTAQGSALIAREVAKALGSAVAGVAPGSAVDALWVEESRRAADAPRMSADLAFVWGQIYLRKEMYARAGEMFRTAIALGYTAPYAKLNLAAALRRLGRGPEALALLEELTAADPDFVEPYPLLAELSRESGNLELAVRSYGRVIATGAASAATYAAQGGLLLERGAPAEARAVVEEGLSLHPGDCALLATLGRAWEEGDEAGRAAAVYRDAIARNPACDAAREGLGLLQMQRGEWREAVLTFEDAIRRSGGAYPLHYLNLGVAYYRGLGDRQAAVERFADYCRLEPGDGDVLPPELRAEVLERCGAAVGR